MTPGDSQQQQGQIQGCLASFFGDNAFLVISSSYLNHGPVIPFFFSPEDLCKGFSPSLQILYCFLIVVAVHYSLSTFLIYYASNAQDDNQENTGFAASEPL